MDTEFWCKSIYIILRSIKSPVCLFFIWSILNVMNWCSYLQDTSILCFRFLQHNETFRSNLKISFKGLHNQTHMEIPLSEYITRFLKFFIVIFFMKCIFIILPLLTSHKSFPPPYQPNFMLSLSKNKTKKDKQINKNTHTLQ